MTSEKVCARCGTLKPIEDYRTNPARYDGVGVYCSSCQNAYARSSYLRLRLERPVWAWAKVVVAAAKKRARDRGLAFTLSRGFVESIAPVVCPALGLLLDYTGTAVPGQRFGPNTASLDRIRPDLGYTEDNVQVLSMRANQIKQNATPDEIIAVGEHYQRVLLLHNSAGAHHVDIDL